MATLLAQHFHDLRVERGLNLAQLAAQVGYANVTKGINRLVTFERHGQVHPDLLRKLSIVLGVNDDIVRTLAAEDERRFLDGWNRWADEPVEPYAVVRLLPAVYKTVRLPAGLRSLNEGEAFTADLARQWSRKVCLVISRRYSLWLDEQGKAYARTKAELGQPNGPFMALGRSRRSSWVRSLFAEDFVRSVRWPVRA
jgi:hypothetical protein